jgi:hypothetical protein
MVAEFEKIFILSICEAPSEMQMVTYEDNHLEGDAPMISVINEIIKAMLPDKKKFHAPRSWAIRC